MGRRFEHHVKTKLDSFTRECKKLEIKVESLVDAFSLVYDTH